MTSNCNSDERTMMLEHRHLVLMVIATTIIFVAAYVTVGVLLIEKSSQRPYSLSDAGGVRPCKSTGSITAEPSSSLA